MPEYFQVEISLARIEPRVWRRFLLARSATFQDLHEAIQIAGDWLNYHLFAFRDDRSGRAIAGIPDDECRSPDPLAALVDIDGWLGRAKSRSCSYEYDFGDGWDHEVVIHRTELPDRFTRRLLDGARAFPREDSGGVPGYERYRSVVLEGKDPYGEPLDQSLRWLGGWHPERFDLDDLKARFDRPKPKKLSPAAAAAMAERKKAVASALERFCEKRNRRGRRDRTVEFKIRGEAVTIFERVPALLDRSKLVEVAVARLRYDPGTRLWTLFCADRNAKWHEYFEVEPSPDLADLLREVEADPTGIFWG